MEAACSITCLSAPYHACHIVVISYRSCSPHLYIFYPLLQSKVYLVYWSFTWKCFFFLMLLSIMPSSITVPDENDICLFYLAFFNFLNHCTNISGLLSGANTIKGIKCLAQLQVHTEYQASPASLPHSWPPGFWNSWSSQHAQRASLMIFQSTAHTTNNQVSWLPCFLHIISNRRLSDV